MGYYADADLVWGIALSEEEAEKVRSESLYEELSGYKVGDLGLSYSGDSRAEVHSPILGIKLSSASETCPTAVELLEEMIATYKTERIKDLEEVCQKHGFKFEEPKVYLVASYG